MQRLQSGAVAVATQVHYLVVVLFCQRVEHVLLLLHRHLALELLQFGGLEGLAPHYVELAATALFGRIYLVAETCCAQRATLVKELRIYKLGGKGVVWSAAAEHLACWCVAAVRVAALNHEVFYHAME